MKYISNNVRFMKTNITILLAALLSMQCHSGSHKATELEVSTVQWKYGEGLNVGDWLEFGKGYRIKGDTIFRSDSAVAVVIDIKNGTFGDDDEMEIMSIAGSKKGIYHSKYTLN